MSTRLHRGDLGKLEVRDGVEGHEHVCRKCNVVTVPCWNRRCPTRRAANGRLQSDRRVRCVTCKHGNEEHE